MSVVRATGALVVMAALLAAAPTAAQDPAPAQGGGTAPAVAAEPVQRGTIRAWLSTEGTAQAVRREFLNFDRSGKVVEIGLDADGAPLREGSRLTGPAGDAPGQLIARLDQRDLEVALTAQRAQAEAAQRRLEGSRIAVDLARAAVGNARDTLGRTRQLVQERVAPQRQQQDAETALNEALGRQRQAEQELSAAEADIDAAAARVAQAELDLEQSELRAPFDGVLSFLNIGRGDFVGPLQGSGLEPGQLVRRANAVIIDPSAFEVVSEMAGTLGPSLAPGLEAQITWSGLDLFRAYDAAVAAGQDPAQITLPVAPAVVHSVAPAVAPDSRTVRVRFRTTGRAAALMDGLYVAVRVQLQARENVLTVPIGALQFEAGQASVFVLDGDDGTVSRHKVQLGLGDGSRMEVTQGLEEGELVVTVGHEQLVDGATVRRVEPPAAADSGGADGGDDQQAAPDGSGT